LCRSVVFLISLKENLHIMSREGLGPVEVGCIVVQIARGQLFAQHLVSHDAQGLGHFVRLLVVGGERRDWLIEYGVGCGRVIIV
jgi:hypothetical protein